MAFSHFMKTAVAVALASALAACGGSGDSTNGGGSGPVLTHVLSGSISGLTSSGLILTDGQHKVAVAPGTTSFSFSTELANGAAYAVTVVSQPIGFTDACAIANGSGTIGSGGVNNIAISCHPAQASVTTLAGSGTVGKQDGTGSAAGFDQPYGIAVDASGNLYVADSGNSLIRKITAGGAVSTVAGNGNAGYLDGNGTATSFSAPHGITVDGAGNLYVADTANAVIRKITSQGAVTTLAGQPHNAGHNDGPAGMATFLSPYGIVADAGGNLAVADTGNSLVRTYVAATGNVAAISGLTVGPASAGGNDTNLSAPAAIAWDASGTLTVADTGNNRIRKLVASSSGNTIATLAGSGSPADIDGTGTGASFNQPLGVAVDAYGNVYTADQNVVRKITPAGVVTTLAGSGTAGSADGVGAAAAFNAPAGVAVDAVGNVYVADQNNHRIRKISPQ